MQLEHSAQPFSVPKTSDQTDNEIALTHARADIARLQKRLEYLELENQNNIKKLDQNAVYYNDRISTLESELLASKRQLMAKDEEIFTSKNQLRAVEADLARSKETLASAEVDFSRQKQYLSDQLAFEQRKIQMMETQQNELHSVIRTKDSELQSLKLASISSSQNTTPSIDTKLLQEEKQQLQEATFTLKASNQTLISELQDVKFQLDSEKRKRESQQEEISQLQNQLLLLTSGQSSGQEQLRQISSLKQQVQDAERGQQEALYQLKLKDTEMERLQNQFDMASKELRSKLEDTEKSKLFLSHSITEKDQESAILRKKMELMEQNESRSTELAQYRDKEMQVTMQREQEIANLRGKIEELKVEMSLLQTNLSTSSTALHIKNEEVDGARALNRKLQDNINQLEKDKRDRDLTIMQLNSQLDDSNLEIARLQSIANQVDYMKEVVRLREEDISKMKLEIASLQQQAFASKPSTETGVDSSLRMEISFLKTKLDSSQLEVRSKSDEVELLQNKLKQTYQELSSLQNQVRNLQGDLKSATSDVEHLTLQLHAETEMGAQKDKKLRGFREELLHLQKRLSEAEQVKRKEKDLTNASTQTIPEATKQLRHQGVQKDVVGYEVGVTAKFEVEQRHVGVQSAAKARELGCQTESFPQAAVDSTERRSEEVAEMKVQMDYVCNTLLKMIASKDHQPTDSSPQLPQRREGAIMRDNYVENRFEDHVIEASRKSNSRASKPFPSSSAAHHHQYRGRHSPEERYSDEENVTPTQDRRAAEVDDLESVSELKSPDSARSKVALVDQLGRVFSQVLHATVGYKIGDAKTARMISKAMSGGLDSVDEKEMLPLIERKRRSSSQVLLNIAKALKDCKDTVRQGRQMVSQMKSNYRAESISRDQINEFSSDLNLGIRLARKLQEVYDSTKRDDRELSRVLDQMKQKLRRQSSRNAERAAELIVSMDIAVDGLSRMVSSLIQQLSGDNEIREWSTDDVSDEIQMKKKARFESELPRSVIHTRHSSSPPLKRPVYASERISTIRNDQLLRVASLSPTRGLQRSSNYREKLDIIQKQLSTAQQKQVDSLRDYDRHYR